MAQREDERESTATLTEIDDLLRDRELLRCLKENFSDLIFIKDLKGFYRGCNKASERFIGLSEEEQIGKSDLDFFDRDMAEAIREIDREVFEEGKPHRLQEWVQAGDGAMHFMDSLKAPYFGPDGEVLGLVGISRDITEQKQMEEALLAKEREYRTLVENLPACIARFDADCRHTFVNKSVTKTFDIPRDFFIGKTLSECGAPGREQENIMLGGKIRLIFEDGVPNSMEAEWQTVYGTRCFHILHVPELDEGGRVVSVLVIAHDITERKRAEEALLKLNEELDQRVKDRTAELETKNAELERMISLFVGRELRMAELKERIRALGGKYPVGGETDERLDS
jgi:PAS domain S-box-containing protein